MNVTVLPRAGSNCPDAAGDAWAATANANVSVQATRSLPAAGGTCTGELGDKSLTPSQLQRVTQSVPQVRILAGAYRHIRRVDDVKDDEPTYSHLLGSELRVLVFGGRDYPYEAYVHEELLQLTDGVPFNRVTIIHGDCNRKKKRGADYYAHTFCEKWLHEGIIEDPHPAKWDDLTVPGAVIRTRSDGSKYNVRAGFQRNAEMLAKSKPTHARGFHGGTGTADMRRLIEDANRRGAGIQLRMVDY
jgi:hypothetical protein